VIEMGATTTSEFNPTTKVSDTAGISHVMDDAFAGLATGNLNERSAFTHDGPSAQHYVDAGQLPAVQIIGGDLTKAQA
jgi:hypothetical protein